MPKPLDPTECVTLVRSDRWQSKVGLDDSGCIVWMATRTHAGYGAVRLSNGMARAHRVAWVAAEGKDVPDGLTIDHLCRNRACVNPEHLEAVTQQENTLRGETLPAAQVRRTHCPQGHELTEDNLAPWRLPRRICLTCLRERDRARYAAKRVREFLDDKDGQLSDEDRAKALQTKSLAQRFASWTVTAMSEARNTAETWQRRAEKAEADALVLIANNETLQREAKDAWRRVDEYARIVQRVVGVCEDKYVGPPTEYGQGFQEGYNDALGVVMQAALGVRH